MPRCSYMHKSIFRLIGYNLRHMRNNGMGTGTAQVQESVNAATIERFAFRHVQCQALMKEKLLYEVMDNVI